jgi:hypothetical protein
MWVAGDIGRVLDKSHLVPYLKGWLAVDVREYGFESSEAMYAFFDSKIVDDPELELICQIHNSIEIVAGMNYDRAPVSACSSWNFKKDDLLFVLGWNVRKSYPLTLDEPPDFNGVIDQGLPQHFGMIFYFTSKSSKTTILSYVYPRRQLTYRWFDYPCLHTNKYSYGIAGYLVYLLAYYTVVGEPRISMAKFVIKGLCVLAISVFLPLSAAIFGGVVAVRKYKKS